MSPAKVESIFFTTETYRVAQLRNYHETAKIVPTDYVPKPQVDKYPSVTIA